MVALDEKPHYEYDEPGSQSDYGKFKVRCEQVIQDVLGEEAVIIRIPEIHGRTGLRMERFEEAVRTQKPIPTYRNLFMNYTTNHQIAEWLAYIIENDLKGIFHIGTKDMCDYSVFEKELLEALAFGEPVFDVHEEDEPFYQAVLPGREEIPESLQMTVKDVIRYLAEKQEDVT